MSTSEGPTVDEPQIVQGGQPTNEEMVALVAAVEAAWPRPAGEAATPTRPTRWRFSGRWWSRPLPSRRDRPR